MGFSSSFTAVGWPLWLDDSTWFSCGDKVFGWMLCGELDCAFGGYGNEAQGSKSGGISLWVTVGRVH